MSFAAYLRDRRAYIAAYLIFGLLTVTIVQLDLRLSGSSLRLVNVAYLFLLGVIGLAVYLWYDFRKVARYFARLAEAASAESMDHMGVLAEPRSREQALYTDAWMKLYARLRGELAEEQERGRRRVHVIAQWAHHMKTPVSVISLELQKARETGGGARETDGNQSVMIQSVAEEADRLDHLLQLLLNTVRIDDFESDFRVERVDLRALVRRVINENKGMFIAHRVYPRLEGAPESSGSEVVVETDAKWLQIVLEQLFSNAVKYASRPDGEGRVAVRLRRTGEETELEVEDDGIGVDPEDLGHVFEPFFTGANGRIKGHSTGMGLYLAREVCRRLGHTIAFHSRPGQGARVCIGFRAKPTIHTGLEPHNSNAFPTSLDPSGI